MAMASRVFSSAAAVKQMDALRVAVVGQGVVGLSSALALLEKHPHAKVTVLGDRPFEELCSYGPAGLFRVDHPRNRDLARPSFARFAYLHRTRPGEETGVKLVSGTIESDTKEILDLQEAAYGDTVYGFRWQSEREMKELSAKPSKYGIFFTSFASEGNRYVPFLRRELEKTGEGIRFESRQIKSIDELGAEFDVVVNCAGLAGGILAGDDNTVVPNRGVALQVHAPWHKHFYYRGVNSFTIPMTDGVALGTTRQDGRTDLEVTDEDRKDIWSRYLELHPNMKGARVIREWVGLRPLRKDGVRLEKQLRKAAGGKQFLVVHNYGHGGNGFTLGWGCALRVLEMIEEYARPSSQL